MARRVGEVHWPEFTVGEFRGVKIRAKLRFGEVCVAEIRTGDLRAGKVRAVEVRAWPNVV